MRYCAVLCCNGSSVLCYAVTAPLCCAVLYCALLSHRAICCKWLSSSASATSWSTATTGSGTTSTSCGERPLERERDTDSHRERESVGYADCCCGGLLVVLYGYVAAQLPSLTYPPHFSPAIPLSLPRAHSLFFAVLQGRPQAPPHLPQPHAFRRHRRRVDGSVHSIHADGHPGECTISLGGLPPPSYAGQGGERMKRMGSEGMLPLSLSGVCLSLSGVCLCLFLSLPLSVSDSLSDSLCLCLSLSVCSAHDDAHQHRLALWDLRHPLLRLRRVLALGIRVALLVGTQSHL